MPQRPLNERCALSDSPSRTDPPAVSRCWATTMGRQSPTPHSLDVAPSHPTEPNAPRPLCCTVATSRAQRPTAPMLHRRNQQSPHHVHNYRARIGSAVGDVSVHQCMCLARVPARHLVRSSSAELPEQMPHAHALLAPARARWRRTTTGPAGPPSAAGSGTARARCAAAAAPGCPPRPASRSGAWPAETSAPHTHQDTGFLLGELQSPAPRPAHHLKGAQSPAAAPCAAAAGAPPPGAPAVTAAAARRAPPALWPGWTPTRAAPWTCAPARAQRRPAARGWPPGPAPRAA